ncbi:MAG TPA: TIGR03435 family protein, partial [Vicinamibacterales bacterium]|nr:TIGR03435 family protein [Vicinamibacterales bacterium]
MSIVRNIVAVAIAATATVHAQTFDVVSIKRLAATAPPAFDMSERPDGGLTMTGAPITVLIAQAYPPAAVADLVGLPDWATKDRFDFKATASLLKPSRDDRRAMLRAMLADRFKLAVHTEAREQPVYDLVFARSDRRLGANIKPTDVDCDAKAAAAEAARAAGTTPSRQPQADVNTTTAPICGVLIRGNYLEGDMKMTSLAIQLRSAAGRLIVDKTGLTGSFRVKLTYDVAAGRRGPETAPPPDAPPSVFTAVQEQLGLKLESS